MEGLKMIPMLALIITIAGVVIGASAVTLSKFGETTNRCFNTSFSYSTTQNACLNNSLMNVTLDANSNTTKNFGFRKNFSYEYDAVAQGLDAETAVAGQLPTVGVIGMLVVILSVLSGVFVYMKYFS